MKKIILGLGLFLSVSILSAQHFDVRAYGGFNVSQLTSDEGATLIDGTIHQTSFSGRPGAEFGASVTFGGQFYIQPGLKYSLIASETVNFNQANNTTYKDEVTISTFSVPLKFGFRLINPEHENIFNVRLFGGFDGHHVTSVNHSSQSGKINDIEKDDFESLIINADFGMGVDLWILYVDLGYQMGLSPVFTQGDNHAKANSFYTNIGLRFSF